MKYIKQLCLVVVLSGVMSHVIAMAPPSLAQRAVGSAAGILPIYTISKPEGPHDPKTGLRKNIWVKYALLGREASGGDKGAYADFGGGGHGKDYPWVTAAREFAEEAIAAQTINMSESDIIKHIDPSDSNTKNVLVDPSGNSVTYITYFSRNIINKLIDKFYLARAGATEWKFREKDILAAVQWKILKQAILGSVSNSGIKVWAKEKVYNSKTGKIDDRATQIILRPSFAARVRRLLDGRRYTPGSNPKVRFY